MNIRSSFVFSVLTLSFLLIGSAAAAPIACPTSGNYADLMATNATGGCLVADKLFTDFTYQSSSGGGALAVEADDFNYLTIANPPVAVGFQFQFALTALANQANDILLSWLVTGPNITSNHLVMAGGAIGDGLASIVETYCKGGPIAGCANSGGLVTYSTPGLPSVLSDSASFAPVTQVGVFKNINVTAGSNGFATISGMTQTVDQLPFNDDVPEPATMFLGGASLVGLGLLRRFRS